MLVALLFVAHVFSGVSSLTDCEAFISNTNFAFLMSTNNTPSTGMAEWYANHSYNAWDQNGKLVSSGTWKITQGVNWCYMYDFPIGSNLTWSTFTVSQPTMSWIGCLSYGSEYYENCTTDLEWTNWFSARLRYRL